MQLLFTSHMLRLSVILYIYIFVWSLICLYSCYLCVLSCVFGCCFVVTFCWIALAGLGNFLFADTDIENRCHEQWPSSNASLYISHPSQIGDLFTFLSLFTFLVLFSWDIFRYEIIGLHSAAKTYNSTVFCIWWERCATNKCFFLLQTENLMRKKNCTHK